MVYPQRLLPESVLSSLAERWADLRSENDASGSTLSSAGERALVLLFLFGLGASSSAGYLLPGQLSSSRPMLTLLERLRHKSDSSNGGVSGNEEEFSLDDLDPGMLVALAHLLQVELAPQMDAPSLSSTATMPAGRARGSTPSLSKGRHASDAQTGGGSNKATTRFLGGSGGGGGSGGSKRAAGSAARLRAEEDAKLRKSVVQVSVCICGRDPHPTIRSAPHH